MRRFPSSWDRTLAALGFRRNVKRIKRDHYRRKNSRIEPLEVRAMLAANNLLGTETHHWTFDTDGTDSVGTVDTSLNNGAYIDSSTGFLGSSALRLDGSDDHGYIDHAQLEDSFSKYSITAWFYANNTSGSQIIYEEGGVTNGIALRLNGSDLQAAVGNNADLVTTSISGVSPNEWHFAVVTFDNGSLTLYLDGSEQTNTANAAYTSIPQHTDAAGIGRQTSASSFGAGTGSYFEGLLDDIRVFNNHVLSPIEISFLENANLLSNDSYVVTTLVDQSDGNLDDGLSLREAIAIANLTPGADSITFSESLFASGSQTIVLGDTDGNGLIEGNEDPTQLEISDDLTIIGPDSEFLTISGANDARVFKITNNLELDVEISGLTIANGRSGAGAGIYSHGNNLAIDDVHFQGNYAMTWDETNQYFTAGSGGAINFQGQDWLDHSTLTITNSTYDGNYASHGGAIYSYGGYADIEIDAVTFSNNHAFYRMDDQLEVITTGNFLNGFGGALSLTSYDLHNSGIKGSVEIKNSTFHHNEAERDGGAIATARSYFTVDIINSTISSNTALRSGGIKVSYDQDLTIVNSTITENSVTGWSTSGGIENLTTNPANLTLHNTIVAGNTNPSGNAYDLRGDLETDSSHNLIGNWTYPVTLDASTDNQIDSAIDPGLAPLGEYGGATLTHALETNSLAIDGGENSVSFEENDQRGGTASISARVYGDIIDIGAYEYGGTTIETSEAEYIATADPIDVAAITSFSTVSSSWVASNAAGDTVTVWNGTGDEGTGTYYSILNGATGQLSQPRLVDLGQELENYSPKVVIDQSGDFAISWLSRSAVDHSMSYWIRRYDSSGSPIDALPVLIADDLDGYFDGYSITTNESGRILVVWQDNDPINGSLLYFRRFTTTGLSLDAAPRNFFPTTTNGISLTTSGRTAVVKSDGGFYLNWEEAGQIKLAEFSPDGFQSGEAVVIASAAETNSSVTAIDISIGPNDVPYVAWKTEDWVDVAPNQGGDTAEENTFELLAGPVIDGAVSNPTIITSGVSHDEWGTDGPDEWFSYDESINVNRPSLAVDGLGRYGFAWENSEGWYSVESSVVPYVGTSISFDSDTTDLSLRVAWFGVDGQALQTAPVKIGVDPADFNRYPTLTSDASGIFVLTTQKDGEDLWAQQFVLPQAVSLDEEGTLTFNDRIGQFEELSLGTELVEGDYFVTFNGIRTQYEASEVKKIVIKAGAGDNKIDLSRLDTSKFDLQGSIDPVTLTAPIEVYGGAGNDVLFAPEIGALLNGEAGDDQLIGSEVEDLLLGGEGDDLIVGNEGDDLLIGGLDNDTLKGGEGDDDLYGGQGNDYLLGEAGYDDLYGEEGNDRLDGGVNDLDANILNGGQGDDTYLLQNQEEGVLGTTILIDDISGIDTVDLSEWNGTLGVNLDLSAVGLFQQLNTTDAHSLVILPSTTLENVIGTPNDDELTGNSEANQLEGREGDDILKGLAGDDTLLGHAGDDELHGEAGDDSLFGHDGNDSLYSGITADNGGGGNDRLDGGVGDDVYHVFQEEPNNGVTITTINVVTINDDAGGSDKLDLTAAAYTDSYTDPNTGNSVDIRVIALDTDDDQTLGNVTLVADGLSDIDIFTETEGLILPPATDLPEFYAGFDSDVENATVTLPLIDLTSWTSTATELDTIPWTHSLQLKNPLPASNDYFFTLGEDAPEGMTLDPTSNLLSWTPGAGQEGVHAFSIYATRYGTAIVRTSTEVSITVANSNLPPEIVANSIVAKGIEGTLYGAIEGEVFYHDPLDDVDILLTYSSPTNSIEVTVQIEIDANDPYRARFEYQLSDYEISDLLDGATSVDLSVSALPRTLKIDETYTLHSSVSMCASGSYCLTLNPSATSLATLDVFELNRFGESGTLKATTDPTFVGSVSKSNGVDVEDLSVRFFFNDGDTDYENDIEIGRTRTNADGTFSFTPDIENDLLVTFSETHKYEELDVYALVYDRLSGELYGSDTASSPKTLNFTLVQETAPQVELSVVNNNTSVFAELEGSINWQDASLTLAEKEIFELAHRHDDVTIEISYDIDVDTVDDNDLPITVSTTIEGIAVTNELGEFTYLPVGLEVGVATTFSAKAVYWDDHFDTLVESGEKNFTFTPVLSDSSLVAGDLQLKYPKDAASLNGEATDPTIVGVATKDGVAQGNLYVEYSIGADFGEEVSTGVYKEADGVVITDEEGQFEFTPIGLALGVLTPIYVRAAERNITVEDDTAPGADPDDVIVTESWTYQELANVNDNFPSINVTLEAATLPTIENLELTFDTGSDTSDQITSNPTIRGNVADYYGDMSVVTVEYMVNGVVAGELTPEEDGSFEFLAEGYIDGMAGGANEGDTNEVLVRAIIPDFTTEVPEFENGLLGTDADGDATSGWFSEDYFSGSVGWSSTINEDWFDEVLADEGVGLQGDWYNSSFTRDWEGVLDKIEGAWSDPFSFTYDSTATLVASATVVHDGGTDPTFYGKLSSDDAASTDDILVGKVLEFYLNGSTEPDGRTKTHELIGTGSNAYNYSYTPSKFTENNDIRIVIIEPVYGSDSTQEIAVTSPYDDTGVKLDIGVDTALVVSSLELANPLTKANATNPATATDPTLEGHITIPGDVALQIVEFDYNNDGLADAYTYTDAEGGFWHQPEGIGSYLIGDTLSVRARVVYQVLDHDNHTVHNTLGDWSEALTWTNVSPSAPEFVFYQLEQDTGHYEDFEVLDGETSNPNLIGKIVAGGVPVAYQTVEFDYNGDGVIDGRSSTDSEGRFRYEPEGLTVDENWDIRARVNVEDVTNDTYLSTAWTSVTRTGRPGDTASGIGFRLVSPVALEVSSFIQNSPDTTDPSLSGTVNWSETNSSPVAKNVVVEFFDTSDNTRLGSTVTDENGNFSFVPIGIVDDMTIVAKPVQSVVSSNPTYSDPTLTVDFDLGSTTAPSVSVSQVDFSTVKIESSSSSSVAYYEIRVVEPTDIWGQPDIKHEAEIVPAEVSYSSSGTISYRMNYEFDYASYPDDAEVEVRKVSFNGTSYEIGQWGTAFLPAKANLFFVDDPDFQREQDLNSSSSTDEYVATVEAQVITKIADANSDGFSYNGNAVSWEYEVEYDLDGDGVADYRFTVEDPTSSLTHELTGIEPGDYDLRSRVIGYGTFNEAIQTGNSTVIKETTLYLEGDWFEQPATYTNPGPTVAVETEDRLDGLGQVIVDAGGNAVPYTTDDSQPVATEATIVGSIESSLYAEGESLAGLTVQVDEDLDGYVDGYAYVQADGTFEYTLSDPSIGDNSIQLRGVDPYSSTTNLEGDWTGLTITLAPEVAPEITSLELETYELVGVAGSLPKTDSPVILGTVNLPANTAALTQWVEFDHDGDGIADGSATLDSFGNFEYTPTNLAYGTHYNQRARTVIQLPTQQLVGEWSDDYTETPQQSIFFLYEPDSLPEISGEIEVLDVALGLVAGRATLEGFGYAGKVVVSVQQLGVEVSSLTTYSSDNGRFELELLELAAGDYDLVITPQVVDSNAASGYYDGESRTETITYAPTAINGTPELSTFELAYNTGSASAPTSDPTLEGAVDLTAYNDEAPPQLYVEITYDTGANAVYLTLPVRPDGTFEWTSPGLAESDNYQYTARTKIWNPALGDYDYGSQTKTLNFELIQGENLEPSVSSLEMQFNEALAGEEVHVSADAIFSGQISNDGRLGGHTVYFDHNQDGLIDGQTITLDDGSFFYRADGIEASDTLVQTMTAWVVETDYWGEELTSTSLTRDFKLSRAPIVREVTYNSSANKVIGSLFSEIDAADLWIEYEFFGASLPAGNPPADVYDYASNYAGLERQFVSVDSLGNFEIDLPAGSTGNLSLFLRGVDSRNLDLSSTTIDAYDPIAYETDAIKGSWNLSSFDTNPTTVGNFRLLEDTGANDGITSNPTVAGTVRPYEVVTIKTLMLAPAGGGAYEVDNYAIDRITADGNGNFEFVSPAFESNSSTYDRFEVTAKTVSFDLENGTESYGAETAPITFDYVENGTSISVSVDNDGFVTGTVSANAINGRVAGLRVELDVQYGGGQAYDGIADGYAITDSNGDFSYQIYGITQGQQIDLKAQVIEWDAERQEFTDPAFDTNLATVDSATFTANSDVGADPALSEEVNTASEARANADLVLTDTVMTVLANVSELNDSGNIDLGVWSIDTLTRGGVAEAGPEADSSAIGAVVATSIVSLSGITEFSRVLENPQLSGDLGTFEVSFTASRAWGTDENGDDTLTTSLEVWLEEYNHDEDPSLDFAFANDSGTPTYSFQFVATGTKTSTDFEIDTYTTIETSSYDFYTEDQSYTPDGTLYQTEITAGSYEHHYTEEDVPVINGTVTRNFISTEISNIETWVTNNDADSSDGITSTSSDHSTYYERSVSDGTISAAGISGTQTITAQGFYESNYTSTYTSTEDLTSTDANGNLLLLTDTSSDSLSSNYLYRGNLNTENVYTVGGTSSLTFNLSESINSSYNQNGIGTYERADESGNWYYTAQGSASSNASLNGKSYEGTDYSTLNATIDSSSTLSSSGTGGGSGNYDEGTATNGDSGTYSSDYSYSSSSNVNTNASLSSYNEDYAVRGSQLISSNVYTSDRGEVDGELTTTEEESSSQINYGSRTRSSAGASSSTNSNFNYDSHGNSNTTGSYQLNANASGVIATQSSGEFVDTSTDTTVTTPFRDNMTIESSLTFTSDGDFSSEIAPGVEEVFSVTGNNTREEKSEIRSTEYFAINTIDSEGNPGEANAENFSLTKTQYNTEALEDYQFESSNGHESREGEFENNSNTTVEVTESIVYETEESSADGNEFENTKYSSKKDSFLESTSSSEGPFSEINGQSKAYATVDETFATFGKEKETYKASGQAPAIQDGERVLENWSVYSKEEISYDTTTETSGYVDLVNEEAVDSLMNVETENESKISTIDRSSLITTGTKKVNERTVFFTEGGGLKESLTLSNEGKSEGTVEHDGSSLMSVDSTEKIEASTKNSSYYIEGTPLGSLFYMASSYIYGSSEVTLDKTTETEGEVSQGGATTDTSATQIDLRDPSSSFDISTRTKTTSSDKSKWNIKEHEGELTSDNADTNYRSSADSGETKTSTEVTERVNANVNQYKTGDRYEKGDFFVSYETSESNYTTGGGGSYREDGKSGYNNSYSNIGSVIPSNTIEGTYTDLNGDLTIKYDEETLKAVSNRKDTGTYLITSGQGEKEKTVDGLSGSSSSNKSEGGGGKDSTESKSNSFSRNKNSNGSTSSSNTDSNSTSKSVVDGDKASSTASNSYNKDNTTKDPIQTTTYYVYSSNSQSASANGDNRRLNLQNESGSGKVVAAEYSNGIKSSSDTYETYESNLTSNHNVNNEGDAHEANFNSSSESTNGTKTTYLLDKSYTESNGTKFDEYVKKNEKDETFTEVTEWGSYFDDEGRRQAADYTIETGTREIYDGNKDGYSFVTIDDAFSKSSGTKNGTLTRSITTEGNYDIYGGGSSETGDLTGSGSIKDYGSFKSNGHNNVTWDAKGYTKETTSYTGSGTELQKKTHDDDYRLEGIGYPYNPDPGITGPIIETWFTGITVSYEDAGSASSTKSSSETQKEKEPVDAESRDIRMEAAEAGFANNPRGYQNHLNALKRAEGQRQYAEALKAARSEAEAAKKLRAEKLAEWKSLSPFNVRKYGRSSSHLPPEYRVPLTPYERYERGLTNAIAEAGAGFVPVVGEAQDFAVATDPAQSITNRVLAGGSLFLNLLTAGLLPNFGGFIKNADELGNLGRQDLMRFAKEDIVQGIDEVAPKGGKFGDLDTAGGTRDRHHMPADSASPLSKNDGPAIEMDREDHRRTASYGGGPDSAQQRYRDQQKELIDQGRFDEAFEMDVDDIRSKFGDKYDGAVEEAREHLP